MLIGIAYELGIADARPGHRDTRFEGYGRQPRPDLLRDACDQYLEPAPIKEGGVLLIRFARDPQHVAIVSQVDPPQIIHALVSPGRVVEHILDEKWRRRIVRSYRFKWHN